MIGETATMNQDQSGGLAAQTAKHEVASYERLPSATPDRAEPGRILADRMVAMRDGVELASDIYLPAGDGPFPTILTRMPSENRRNAIASRQRVRSIAQSASTAASLKATTATFRQCTTESEAWPSSRPSSEAR